MAQLATALQEAFLLHQPKALLYHPSKMNPYAVMGIQGVDLDMLHQATVTLVEATHRAL